MDTLHMFAFSQGGSQILLASFDAATAQALAFQECAMDIPLICYGQLVWNDQMQPIIDQHRQGETVH